MSEAMDQYVKANESFEEAQKTVKNMGTLIKEVGERISRYPFDTRTTNINGKTGFAFVQGYLQYFDGNLWPNIEFIDKALVKLQEAREDLEKAHENLSHSEKKIVRLPDMK